MLIGSEDIGIRGGPISTVVCFWLIALLDLFIIKRTLPRSLSMARVFVKPVGAAAAMGASAWAVNGLCYQLLVKLNLFLELGEDEKPLLDAAGNALLSRAGTALAVAAAIGVAVVVYFALILVTRAISKEDLALLPKGDKIARILRVE